MITIHYMLSGLRYKASFSPSEAAALLNSARHGRALTITRWSADSPSEAASVAAMLTRSGRTAN